MERRRVWHVIPSGANPQSRINCRLRPATLRVAEPIMGLRSDLGGGALG